MAAVDCISITCQCRRWIQNAREGEMQTGFGTLHIVPVLYYNKVNQSPDNSCRTEFLDVLCCVKRQFMALFYISALRQRWPVLI